MKFITKGIKSISDVITNSSSEVFVMCKTDAEYYDKLENTNGCININEITWNNLKNCRNEWEMVCNTCDINPEVIRGKRHTGSEWWENYYEGPSQKEWENFLDIYHDTIQNKLIGFYWVDIEDHFENAYDVSEDARDDSIWSDYRH